MLDLDFSFKKLVAQLSISQGLYIFGLSPVWPWLANQESWMAWLALMFMIDVVLCLQFSNMIVSHNKFNWPRIGDWFLLFVIGICFGSAAGVDFLVQSEEATYYMCLNIWLSYHFTWLLWRFHPDFRHDYK